ncbi:hypothetical protein [Streptomyces osmaniensis]
MSEPFELPGPPTEEDCAGDSFSPVYTTTVTVNGGPSSHGRASGRARSADGVLDIDLRIPAELSGDGGYLLHIDLLVGWPDIDPESAAPLLERADSLCPYARMARRGTPTTITLAQEISVSQTGEPPGLTR